MVASNEKKYSSFAAPAWELEIQYIMIKGKFIAAKVSYLTVHQVAIYITKETIYDEKIVEVYLVR